MKSILLKFSKKDRDIKTIIKILKNTHIHTYFNIDELLKDIQTNNFDDALLWILKFLKKEEAHKYLQTINPSNSIY